MDLERIHKLTVGQVLRMVEEGILDGNTPVELLDGVLIDVSPQGPPHVFACGALAERLRGAYGTDALVREDNPLVASPHSLPEPDIAVVRGTRRDFAERHPEGREALLVVEVADMSQQADHRKAALYAAAGVPVYWILDLPARKLIVFEQPAGEYAMVRILGPDDEVAAPERSARWRVADLLP